MERFLYSHQGEACVMNGSLGFPGFHARIQV